MEFECMILSWTRRKDRNLTGLTCADIYSLIFVNINAIFTRHMYDGL